MSSNKKAESGRVQGAWSLLFVLLGLVAFVSDPGLLLFTTALWGFIWMIGCSARDYSWPVDMSTRAYVFHAACMLFVSGLLLGLSLGEGQVLTAALVTGWFICFYLSVDLIVYPTKHQYEERMKELKAKRMYTHPKSGGQASPLWKCILWLRKVRLTTIVVSVASLVTIIALFGDAIVNLTALWSWIRGST